jgi:general secretion pathway protein J
VSDLSTRRGVGGFTLIEALVALSIFSFIGVAAYQLLSSTSRLRESGESRFRAVTGLQLAMRQLDEDFSQFAARPIPTGRAEADPALDTEPADADIEFTRAGWRNPLGLPRAKLQRVAWILDEQDRLLRRYRLNLDDADPDETVERVYAEGVEELAFRFLDDKGRWGDAWPPESSARDAAPGTDAAGRARKDKNEEPVPVAVEVTIVHAQVGEVQRVIAIR